MSTSEFNSIPLHGSWKGAHLLLLCGLRPSHGPLGSLHPACSIQARTFRNKRCPLVINVGDSNAAGSCLPHSDVNVVAKTIEEAHQLLSGEPICSSTQERGHFRL